jgi:hypothetical protein
LSPRSIQHRCHVAISRLLCWHAAPLWLPVVGTAFCHTYRHSPASDRCVMFCSSAVYPPIHLSCRSVRMMSIRICVFCGACDCSSASLIQATRGFIRCHVSLSVKGVTFGLLSKFLFNRCKLIDTERSELDKSTRTVRGAAMLLLLRRVLKDVLFCAF